MKRIDLNQADAALVAQCVQLAGADSVRQKMAVDLLVNAGRWPAVLACLKAMAKQHGREAAQQLALPPGHEALIHIASRDKAAPVATLDALRALAWVNSDAQALALARKPEPWESEFAPITPPSQQQWLNEGLRDAVLGDALDKLHW